MRFVKRRPFLCLALFTIAAGAAWHLAKLPNEGPLYALVYLLGFPFITLTRLATPVLGPALAGVVSLALGTLLYLLADHLLHRLRKQK